MNSLNLVKSNILYVSVYSLENFSLIKSWFWWFLMSTKFCSNCRLNFLSKYLSDTLKLAGSWSAWLFLILWVTGFVKFGSYGMSRMSAGFLGAATAGAATEGVSFLKRNLRTIALGEIALLLWKMWDLSLAIIVFSVGYLLKPLLSFLLF